MSIKIAIFLNYLRVLGVIVACILLTIKIWFKIDNNYEVIRFKINEKNEVPTTSASFNFRSLDNNYGVVIPLIKEAELHGNLEIDQDNNDKTSTSPELVELINVLNNHLITLESSIGKLQTKLNEEDKFKNYRIIGFIIMTFLFGLPEIYLFLNHNEIISKNSKIFAFLYALSTGLLSVI